MLGGMNPKKMQAVMKQMRISQEEINASKVIIEKTDGSKIIIENPSVIKVKMQGQESFQISGEIMESDSKTFAEDLRQIIEKTGCSEEEAKESLEKTGDLAESILDLSK